MKHLDVTIDFETCALGANAAVIQLAAVAWDRHADENPFLLKNIIGESILTVNDGVVMPETFNQSFDIRDQVFMGRKFEEGTIDFWADKQKTDVKSRIMDLEPMPTTDVICNFYDWIRYVMNETGKETVCLWAQGSDFDIAILRNIIDQYGILPSVKIPHTSYRDARTFILEGAASLLQGDEAVNEPNKVYKALSSRYGEMPYQGSAHDALYDSMRTSWNVWNVMNILRS